MSKGCIIKPIVLLLVSVGINTPSVQAQDQAFPVASVRSLKVDIAGGHLKIRTLEGTESAKVIYDPQTLSSGCRFYAKIDGSELIVYYKPRSLVPNRFCKADFEIVVPPEVSISVSHEHGTTSISGNYKKMDLNLVFSLFKLNSVAPRVVANTVSTESVFRFGSSAVDTVFELSAVGGSNRLELPSASKVKLRHQSMMSKVENEFGSESAATFQVEAKLMSSFLRIVKTK
ncbi:MAG: hypothetical protein AB1540_04255 [Bdellovibrionota bacterium]